MSDPLPAMEQRHSQLLLELAHLGDGCHGSIHASFRCCGRSTYAKLGVRTPCQGIPAPGIETTTVSMRALRIANALSGVVVSEVKTKSVRRSGPPSVQAIARRATSMRSSMAPPSLTRTTARAVDEATQMQPSASRQRPSGVIPRSAQTRRRASDPPLTMSKAANRRPQLSATTRVRPSSVITIPFGNVSSSATTRAVPSVSTSTRLAGSGSARLKWSNPKWPT